MFVRLAANAFVASCQVLEQVAQDAHTVAAAAYMIAFQAGDPVQMGILEAKMFKYATIVKLAHDAAAAVVDMDL